MITKHRFAFLSILLLLLLVRFSKQLQTEQESAQTIAQHLPVGAELASSKTAQEPVRSASSPTLSKQQAVVCALNKIAGTDNGVSLEHPLHTAQFSTDGIAFTPVASDQSWRWSLRHFGSRDANLIPASRADSLPEHEGLRSVVYRYGAFTEVYHPRQKAVEQQFVLSRPLLDGADLVVRGEVLCDGDFEKYASHWQWRDGQSGAVVSLGDVTVFDADGVEIPATMEVNEGATEIVVDGTLLAAASYPVTIDPMIGTDDFLISSTWLGGSSDRFTPSHAEVCYNSDTGLFLVAWLGVTEDQKRDVIGGHIDAAGDPVGDVIRIGESGESIFSDQSEFDHWGLDLVYNPDAREYLVVWQDEPPTGDGEILGQRLNILGQLIGGNFVVRTAPNALKPSVAYNPRSLRYAVTWMENGVKSFAQFLDATGGLVGPAAFDTAPSLANTSSNNVATDPASDGFIFAFGGKVTLGASSALFSQRVSSDGAPLSLFPTPVRDSGVTSMATIRSVEIVESIANSGYAVGWIEPLPSGDDVAKVALLDAAGAPIANRTATLGDDPRRVRIAAASDGASYLASLTKLDGPTQLTAIHATTATATPAGELGRDTHLVSVSTVAGQAVIAFVQTAPLADVTDQVRREVHAAVAPLSALANSSLDWKPVSDSFATVDNDVYALDADVAYDDVNDLHGVVWRAQTISGGSRIWQQTVFADGSILPVDVPHSGLGLEANPNRVGAPKIGFNSRDEEFLIVWTGSDSHTLPGEFEVFVARVVEASQCVGVRVISDSGDLHVSAADLAYSHDDNRFLVAWIGEVDADNEEVFGRLLGGNTAFIGDVFRITRSGPDFIADRDAKHFDLAYSGASEQYTVAYSARNPLPIGGGIERDGVFLQGVSRTGARTAPFAQALHLFSDPNAKVSIANRPSPDGFLVVWDGGDSGFDKIRAQHVDGLGAGNTLPLNGNQFFVSTFQTEHAFNPHVEWNGVRNEFLVTWATDHTASVGSQVVARPVQSQGTFYGPPMVLSAMDGLYDEGAGVVAHDADGDYLAVWSGRSDRGILADANTEIFGQQFTTEDLPFTITGIIREGNDIIVSFSLMPGLHYQVQMSPDMQTWTNLGPVRTSQAGGRNAFSQEGVLDSVEARYYRIVRPAA